MDNVTHALAGALLAAATCRRLGPGAGEPTSAFRRAAFVTGIVAAELPDADLLYAGAPMQMGNLGYLLHHRGHTHTVLFALVGAALVWAMALAFQRALREPENARPLLLLSIAGTLSHIALDYTNSYGVHPFWPVDRRWFYGDAVFIVEPWFWIVSLPALFLIARRTVWRVVCAGLLLAIVVASWRVSMVGAPVALALTLGAIAWFGALRLTPASARVTTALAGWCALELLFFVASGAARRAVREQVGAPYRDVALSPSPGDPFCYSAVLVRLDGDTYGAARATVAPFPRVRDVAACDGRDDAIGGARNASVLGTVAISWEPSWTAPIARLRELAASNCTAAAALRFVRVPVWEREGDGTTVLSDLRFGQGGGGFTTVRLVTGAPCPRLVPGWEFPRSDVLGLGS
jgi:inner membrane protein